MLAFPLSGTSGVDTPPGACTQGSGGNGHVDRRGSAGEHGAGQWSGPLFASWAAPATCWSGRGDVAPHSGPGSRGAKLLLAWGGEPCFLCTALSLPAQAAEWPQEYGALLSRGGIISVDTAAACPPPPPGERPAGHTGETLGRVRRRPWPRTESQETPPRPLG